MRARIRIRKRPHGEMHIAVRGRTHLEVREAREVHERRQRARRKQPRAPQPRLRGPRGGHIRVALPVAAAERESDQGEGGVAGDEAVGHTQQVHEALDRARRDHARLQREAAHTDMHFLIAPLEPRPPATRRRRRGFRFGRRALVLLCAPAQHRALLRRAPPRAPRLVHGVAEVRECEGAVARGGQRGRAREREQRAERPALPGEPAHAFGYAYDRRRESISP